MLPFKVLTKWIFPKAFQGILLSFKGWNSAWGISSQLQCFCCTQDLHWQVGWSIFEYLCTWDIPFPHGYQSKWCYVWHGWVWVKYDISLTPDDIPLRILILDNCTLITNRSVSPNMLLEHLAFIISYSPVFKSFTSNASPWCTVSKYC